MHTRRFKQLKLSLGWIGENLSLWHFDMRQVIEEQNLGIPEVCTANYFSITTVKLTSWINWAEELAKEIFESSVFGMFVGHNSTIGNRQRSGLIHPNGDRNNRWKLEHYALAGKLVGKCIVERALNPKSPQHWIDARFSRTILAMILGVSTSYKVSFRFGLSKIWSTNIRFLFVQHLQMDDPDYFQSNFETVLQNDVSSMGLHFVIRNFDKNGELKVDIQN